MIHVGNNLAKSWYWVISLYDHSARVYAKTGKVDDESNSGEAARRLPGMRPSTAAASMAVESLHLYLGHWPGLTPGLTQVAQPHLWMWTGHNLSETRNQNHQPWHLVTACHPVSVVKEAVEMNVVVASNKCLHVNYKPHAAAKEVNTEWSQAYTLWHTVRLERWGGCSTTAESSSESQARHTGGSLINRSHHHVLTADDPWGASPTHSVPVGQTELHLHTSFWLKSSWIFRELITTRS